jgi:hypothetical protein
LRIEIIERSNRKYQNEENSNARLLVCWANVLWEFRTHNELTISSTLTLNHSQSVLSERQIMSYIRGRAGRRGLVLSSRYLCPGGSFYGKSHDVVTIRYELLSHPPLCTTYPSRRWSKSEGADVAVQSIVVWGGWCCCSIYRSVRGLMLLFNLS